MQMQKSEALSMFLHYGVRHCKCGQISEIQQSGDADGKNYCTVGGTGFHAFFGNSHVIGIRCRNGRDGKADSDCCYRRRCQCGSGSHVKFYDCTVRKRNENDKNERTEGVN